MLNATGCQACGWKFGDPHVRDERVFPFNARAQYPEGVAKGIVRFANRADTPDVPHEEAREAATVPVVSAAPDPALSAPDPTAGVPATAKPKPRSKGDVTIQ